MSALVQRALREPVRFERDIAGPDRKALVGSYSDRAAEQAIRLRRRALGSFRNPAPECDVPSVVTVETLESYSKSIAETCYEQKYVNPGWGIRLTMTDSKITAYDAMGVLVARSIAETAREIRHAL